MTSKVQTTRTLNPLPLEHLEPRRFEDLVRQLAHGFRKWARLENTGRLGDDDGIDVLGVEVPDSAAEKDGEDAAAPLPSEGRVWRIQCKREVKLGPKDLLTILDALVPDPSDPPHGVIIAAACNVSAKALDGFHKRARSLGVREHLVWSRGLIEDMLFLPENDHLLFAYTGLSLQAKRRSRAAAVRHAVSIKRRLAALSERDKPVANPRPIGVFIRDVNDETYFHPRPFSQRSQAFYLGVLLNFGSRGVWVERGAFRGVLFPDGGWCFHPRTESIDGKPWTLSGEEQPNQQLRAVVQQRGGELISAKRLGLLPYAAVVEVDALGDNMISVPHIYCEFLDQDGPFAEQLFVSSFVFDAASVLEESRRVEIDWEEMTRIAATLPDEATQRRDR